MHNSDKFRPYFHSSKPGLYALFVKDVGCLSKIFTPEFYGKIINHMKKYNCENCLYIGKETGKLYTRVEGKHTYGCIRNSTLRYTISYCAGLQRYGVIGIPISKKRKLRKTDEEKITKWIKENFEFRIIETDDYNSLETEFINKYCPPLNIKDNPNSMLSSGERTGGFIFLDKKDFKNL